MAVLVLYFRKMINVKNHAHAGSLYDYHYVMHSGIDKDYVTIFYSFIYVIDLFSIQGYDKSLEEFVLPCCFDFMIHVLCCCVV